MAEDKRSWDIPILNRDNYEYWFRRYKVKLRGKGCYHVVENKMEDYCKVTGVPIEVITQGMEILEISNKETKKKEKIVLNIEKKKDFEKHNAEALELMFRSLSEDDQALVDEYESAFALWNYLNKKYSKTDPVMANIYMNKIQKFEFDADSTIIESWDKLKDYRRKLAAADAKTKEAFSDSALLLVLIQALPPAYEVTIDTLNAQSSLSTEERLKHLEQKELRLRDTEEHAHPAFRAKKSDKYMPPHRRESSGRGRKRRDSSSSSSGNTTSDYVCYLCNDKHFLRHCPYIKIAQKAVREKIKIDKAHDKSSSRHRDRSSRKTDEKKVHFHQTPSPSPSRKPALKKSKGKASGYSAQTTTDEYSTHSDTDSDVEASEHVLLSREEICKVTPSTWPADTGASSHMSDQRNLFRELIPIPRRTIRVGGGVLYAREKGTAVLMCKDGSSMLLADTLFVPNLGVNLLSGRRMCQAGLKGSIREDKLYFKLGKKRIVHATMQQGLYIVTHVANGYEETAFPATLLPSTTLKPAPVLVSQITPSKSDSLKDVETTYMTNMTTTEVAPARNMKRSRRPLTEKEKQRYLLWHRRLNHLGPDKIRNLHKVTTLKEPIRVPTDLEICAVCAIAKMTNSIPKTLSEHEEFLLALIQFDIAGPFPMSLRGFKYFMLVIDSWSRKNWILLLKHKSDAPKALRHFKQDVELETEKKIKKARSDNAPELIKSVREWREAGSGVKSQLTTAASSHQNGPAERNIRTAEADMRAMLKDSSMPIEFWCEAVVYDGYCRDRTDSGPVVDGIRVAPEEAYSGKIPTIDHLKAWGSKCYTYINPKTIPADQRHDKLVYTGREGVFMGFSDATGKHARVYHPETGRTDRVSVFRIDEKIKGGTMDLKLRLAVGPQGTSNEKPDRAPRGRPKKQTIEAAPSQPVESQAQPQEKNTPQEDKPAKHAAKANSEIPDKPKEDVQTMTPTTQRPQPAPAPTPHYFTRSKRKREENEEIENERVAKIIKALLAKAEPTGNEFEFLAEQLPAEFEAAFAATEIAGIKIPQTYKEAMSSPYTKHWKNAMHEEIIALLENGTWKQVIPPKGANLISSKWVYTIKLKPDGSIERFKARLVARGFSQVQGMDYNETFAPTVRMDTLRLFLATVAAEDMECVQFDIKNAFTESHLKEEIYISPPQGVDVKKGYALQILRSLYGLKQAARDWNILIKKELLAWGFVQSLADPCLYVHKEKSLRLLVYVDDIVAAAKKQGLIDWFYEKLSRRFNTRNLGEIHKILGIRVTRDRKNRIIYLDQEQYLRTVLDKFGMKNKSHKDKKIPASDYKAFRPATDDNTRISVSEYQTAIGSLMYAMVLTRPDIAFTLGKLAQNMSDPAEHHGHALKNLFRYLNSTITQKLRYGPGRANDTFAIYTDADWAGDKVDRKSVSGSVGMFYGGPFSWSSKKQRSVATSSCESEYISSASSAKQGQWVAQFFRDMRRPGYIGKNPSMVQMYGDNQGALALVKNPHLHERSKHIDICYHFIRDLVEQGKLKVDYIPTYDMVADGMTKPLQRVAFDKFRSQLGVVC
jgi:hypothetical protein